MQKKPLTHWILGCLFALHGLGVGAASVDDSARMLAGLSAGNSPASLSAAAYNQYAQGLDQSWKRYESRVYLPIRNWFKGELPPQDSPVVFYPFSGPDFPTLNAVYPKAERYVMVAIQAAGKPLDLDAISAADSQRLTAQISKASEKFGHIGFFLTNDLEENAAKKGVTLSPTLTLMFFVSRLGYRIDRILPLQIGADGSAYPLDPDTAANWHSVRFEMRKDGRPVSLDYLRIDLSDHNLLKAEGQRRFIEQHAKFPTLLKAASHLPQNGGFTVVRNAIVNAAPLVVQDETGIDYSLLSKHFSVQLYGGFTRPHHLFNPGHQKALAEAYAKSRNTRPLPFIVGYNKQSGASLQIAARSPLHQEPAGPVEKLAAASGKTEAASKPSPPTTPPVAVDKPLSPPPAKPALAQDATPPKVTSPEPQVMVAPPVPAAQPAQLPAPRQSPALPAKPVVAAQTTPQIPAYKVEAAPIRMPERTLYLSYRNNETAHTAYLDKASALLLQQLAPSKTYFRKDQRVVMTIKLERNGNIRSVEVDRSSGNAQLDKHSVYAVRRLKALPAFPESLAAATDVLGIVLSFPAE